MTLPAVLTSLARQKATSWQVWIALAWLVVFTSAMAIPIPINALDAFPENSLLPPFTSSNNWLGTDQLGRDVFWYLLASARTAWLLTFPPLLGATCVGILIGSLSAYYSKALLRIPFSYLICLSVAALWTGCMFLVYIHWVQEAEEAKGPFWILLAFSFLVMAVVYSILKKTNSSTQSRHSTFSFPLDEAIQRGMDAWTTFPKLLLLLLLSTLAPPSLWTLGIWIGITYWVLAARLTRTRTLQIQNEPYYEAAVALGTSNRRLLLHYIWPAMKGQLLTNLCFNASGLLGIGSTLAFLGIGLPADVPSWGKMLALSRYSTESWWLLAFPFFLLIGSILSLQALGNYFSKIQVIR